MSYGLDKPGHAYGRLGIYKTFADVPSDDRLAFFADAFDRRDLLAEWDAATAGLSSDVDRRQRELSHVRESWTEFMVCEGRDPALADPDHVEHWLQMVVDGTDASAFAGDSRGPKRAYDPYYVTILAFYDWLTAHTDYPHRYNPALMAAVEYHDGTTGRIWRELDGTDPLPGYVDADHLGDPRWKRERGGLLRPDGGVYLTDGGADDGRSGDERRADSDSDPESLSADEQLALAAAVNGVENPSDPLADADERMQTLAGMGVDSFEIFKQNILEGKRPKTIREWEATWSQWTRFMTTQNRHPTCPSDAHVEAFVEALVAPEGENDLFPTQYQPTTVRKKLRLLGSFFEWLNGNAVFPTHATGFNPFNDLKRHGGYDLPAEASTTKDWRIPTEAEASAAVRRLDHVRDRAIVVMQLKLGLRPGEIRTLMLKDLQLSTEKGLLESHYSELGANRLLEDSTGDPRFDEQVAVVMPRKTDEFPDGRDGNESVVPRILLLDRDVRRTLVDWLLIRPDNGIPYVFLSRETDQQIQDESELDDAWQTAFPEDEGWGETEEYRGVSPRLGRYFFTDWYEKKTPVKSHVVDYLRGDSSAPGEHATANDEDARVTPENGFEAMRRYAPQFNGERI